VENVGRIRTNVQHSEENNFFDEEEDDDDVETMGGSQKMGMFISQLPETTQYSPSEGIGTE
jgi:hypothetical protein